MKLLAQVFLTRMRDNLATVPYQSDTLGNYKMTLSQQLYKQSP